MKMIRFNANFYGTDSGGNSRAVFEAGKYYPAADEEARRCIARGIAEEVDVPDEPAADEPSSPAASVPEATPAPTAAAKKK